MDKTRLDKLLDSIEQGDPTVQACDYEMPSPFRSEFKKPEHGFFVERERPNKEETTFKLCAKPGTLSGWPFRDELDAAKKILDSGELESGEIKFGTHTVDMDDLISPPVDKEKAIKLRGKPITSVYTMGSIAAELNPVVDSGEFVSREINFVYDNEKVEELRKQLNAPPKLTFDFRFKV